MTRHCDRCSQTVNGVLGITNPDGPGITMLCAKCLWTAAEKSVTSPPPTSIEQFADQDVIRKSKQSMTNEEGQWFYSIRIAGETWVDGFWATRERATREFYSWMHGYAAKQIAASAGAPLKVDPSNSTSPREE